MDNDCRWREGRGIRPLVNMVRDQFRLRISEKSPLPLLLPKKFSIAAFSRPANGAMVAHARPLPPLAKLAQSLELLHLLCHHQSASMAGSGGRATGSSGSVTAIPSYSICPLEKTIFHIFFFAHAIFCM